MTAGKCKSGKHKMVEKKDGEGRRFQTCDTCGNTPVIFNKKQTYDKNNS